MKKYDFLISIIGRPNIGKSSLFNKLINKNYSLVSNKAGLTIDRKYGDFFYEKKIGLIDTGSIINCIENKLYNEILYQLKLSIEESNIIFFLVDGSVGIINDDFKLINIIKKIEKPILLIVNKIDLFKNYKCFNFKIINIKDILYISLKYNLGIKNLIKYIFIKFKSILNNSYEENSSSYKNILKKNNNTFNSVKISIIGKQNVGKSTFINSVLNENRVIVSNIPGTTKDSIDLNINLNKIDYIITDTAGITDLNIFSNKRNINNKIDNINFKIINNIKISNIIIFIIDIIIGLTNKDLFIINFLIKQGKPIILVFNKCDLISKYNLDIKKSILHEKLKFARFLDIYFISALFKININLILKSINKINEYFNLKIKINFLNKILSNAIKSNKPPILNNIRPKLKFCNIEKKKFYIKIIICGIKLNFISKNYKKYLINYFIENIGYKNIPILIFFKES